MLGDVDVDVTAQSARFASQDEDVAAASLHAVSEQRRDGGPAVHAAVRVLIVGAEHQTADTAMRALIRAGFAVQVVRCADDAIVWIDRLWPELMVVDVGGVGGRGLFLQIRQRGGVPVVMISPSADADDRAWGLDRGADDFVPVPMSPPELVARARSVLRRHPPIRDTGADDLFTAGSVVIDRQTKRVRVRERWITLTGREFALLDFLARHPGETFHRDVLFEKVWGLHHWGRFDSGRPHPPPTGEDRARPGPAGLGAHGMGIRVLLRRVRRAGSRLHSFVTEPRRR